MIFGCLTDASACLNVGISLRHYPKLTFFLRLICFVFSLLFLVLSTYVNIKRYYWSTVGEETVFSIASSASASISLYLVVGLTIFVDLAYGIQLMNGRQTYERLLTVSLIFCFLTYATTLSSIIAEVIRRPDCIERVMNLGIFGCLMVVHFWHFLLKQLFRSSFIMLVDGQHVVLMSRTKYQRVSGA